MRHSFLVLAAIVSTLPACASQAAGYCELTSESDSYMLGPEDTVQIHVLHVEEIGAAPYAIDLRGNMNLPRVGKVHAAGLTLDLLEAE
jgi:protein involved in polysaccharide export with SLBB domain